MRALERYVRAVTAHPWVVLVAVLLATAGLTGGIAKLESDFNVERSLPENHPFIEIDRKIRAEFGGRNTIIVGIIVREGDVWRPEVLSVVRDVTLDALKLPGIMAHAVVSLAAPSVRHVEDAGGSLTIDYLMREVPQTPEDVALLRARLESDPQLRGMLVTPDQKAALVMLDFWSDEDNKELAHRALTLAERHTDAPVDIHLAGEPMLALMDVEQTASMARRIPITFLVIAVMLLVSFRSVQGMLIPMLTATLSTLWALGLMGHTGIAIDSWNAAVPILLIAVAAAHSAQMLKRYVEEVERLGENHAAVVESTIRIGPVMIAAGMTAALGFASLALFGVRSISNFGLSCAYGIASAVVLEMTFIPALRAVLPAPRRLPKHGGLTHRLLQGMERGIVRDGGRPVLIGTAVAILIALAGAAQIRTYGPTREYMPADFPARLALEAIEEHFQGTVTMTMLYEGEPGTAASAAALQHMAALQAELERDDLVLRTASLADIVKTLHRTFNPDDPQPYRVPESQALVAQLLFLGDSPAFERFTDRARSKALVVTYLRTDDSALVGPVVHRTERWLEAHPPPQDVRVLVAGGAGPTVLAVNEHTTIGKLLNTLVVLFTIYLVSSLVLRSPLGGLYVITPIVVSVVMLFGVIGWTRIRLDMGSASMIAMAAGVGADYAIYFIYRLREERRRIPDDVAALSRALETSGRAIIFVAASIGAGFAVMGFSKFLGMRLFGTLMPTAMFFSSLASLSIMPVLVMRTRPAFIFGNTPPVAVPPARAA
jgi:predicted RND superfamily exporter protein